MFAPCKKYHSKGNIDCETYKAPQKCKHEVLP